MATALKFPRGSTVYFLLSFIRDGAALDLTGATLAGLILPGPAAAIADAYGPLAGITLIDALAGIVQLKISPTDTAGLPTYAAPWWRVRATLLNGDVEAQVAHQGPLYLSGEGCDCDACFPLPPVQGVTQTLEPGGTVTLLPPAMANYVANRPDLTTLYGNVATALQGLSAATIAALTLGAVVNVSNLPNRVAMQYKLRANTGAEVDTPTTGQIVTCANAAGKLWELEQVMKAGAPCTWDNPAQLWCQVVGNNGAPALLTGFATPS